MAGPVFIYSDKRSLFSEQFVDVIIPFPTKSVYYFCIRHDQLNPPSPPPSFLTSPPLSSLWERREVVQYCPTKNDNSAFCSDWCLVYVYTVWDTHAPPLISVCNIHNDTPIEGSRCVSVCYCLHFSLRWGKFH
jgi:hypothetical protein